MVQIESNKNGEIAVTTQNTYDFCLFIAGTSPRSSRAIENVRKLCANLPSGVCDLVVVDILQQPQAAKENQIIVVPTLIKKLPKPIRRFIGDMSNEDEILRILEG
jgi:circadian clock protein KaiB